MINLYFIICGANDLYYPIAKNLERILEYIEKHREINFFCLYKIMKIEDINLFKCGNDISLEDKFGGFVYERQSLTSIPKEKFIEKDKDKYPLKIELFLKTYIQKKGRNIVIIIGHGGPFQSLLDLEKDLKSYNTLKLCNILNNFNIDTIFLDMCSMNYLEVIYELLYKKNIEEIITYKNIAPFEGVDYNEILDYLIYKNKRFEDLKGGLLKVVTEDLGEIEKISNEQHNLIKKWLMEEELEICNIRDKFIEKKINIGKLTNVAKKQKGNSLNYIKYFLEDKREREIYSNYKYTKNNFWKILITKKFINESKNLEEAIILKCEGLKNLIYNHNPEIQEKELEKLVESFFKSRKFLKNKF